MGRHGFGLGFRLGLGKRNGLRQKGQIGVETGVSRLRCIRIGIHDEARAETHNTMTGGRRRLRALVFFFLSQSFNDRLEDGLSEKHAAIPWASPDKSGLYIQ